MANTYQQQVLYRKITYLGLILLLAFATYLLRESPWWWSINNQAKELGVREESLGQVELTGSFMRLALTGSRGAAVTVLWTTAARTQMKHEWNDLEVLVDTLTKLQPHFVTPWLFQSWNLSYNVAVESDRVKDKYFYIARGINLLAEGERRNRNNPDLRRSIGFYNEHKIGMSDENDMFRCLFQMSCIDPKVRNPARLRTVDARGNTVVDMEKFEDFCKDHPMLVRRLHDMLRVNSPAEVVAFLADNQNIPSLYSDSASHLSSPDPTTPLKPRDEQFPAQAPLTSPDRGDPSSVSFDCFVVARDWFAYSVEPLPPTTRVLGPLGSETMDFDRTKYRLPMYTPILFRNNPARAQTYVAEFLEKEGWYDRDGWKLPTDWFPDEKFRNGKEAVIGTDVDWALRSWSDAHRQWQVYGENNGLYLSPEQIKSLEDQVVSFRKHHQLEPDQHVSAAPEELDRDDKDREARKIHDRLYWLRYWHRQTNFPHFYYLTQVEQEPVCIELRKKLSTATNRSRAGDREVAMELFRESLPRWRDLMLKHKEFGEDDEVQEAAYEWELRYLNLVQVLQGARLKQLSFLAEALGDAGLRPAGQPLWMPPPTLARNLQVSASSPFAGAELDGKPLIPFVIKYRVRERMRLPPLPGTKVTAPSSGG